MATKLWDGSTDGDVTVAANWSGAAIPAAGDDVIIPANSTVNIDGGTFDNALNSLTVEDGCSITIGSNTAGVIAPLVANLTGYADNTVNLNGTGISYFDFTNATTVSVKKAGTSQTLGVNPLNISCSNAIATLNIMPSNNAKIGIASLGGEVAEFTSINVSGGTLYLGSGVTAPTTITQYGGTVYASTSVTTLNQQAGSFYQKAGGVTTANVYGGTLYYNTTTTITTLADYGTVNFTCGFGSLTVTNCSIYRDASLNDAYERVTFTNGIDLVNSKLSNTTIDIGQNYTITKSAI